MGALGEENGLNVCPHLHSNVEILSPASGRVRRWGLREVVRPEPEPSRRGLVPL